MVDGRTRVAMIRRVMRRMLGAALVCIVTAVTVRAVIAIVRAVIAIVPAPIVVVIARTAILIVGIVQLDHRAAV